MFILQKHHTIIEDSSSCKELSSPPTFLHLHKQMFYICPCQCMESSKKQVCQKIGSRPCFGQLGWLGITL